MSKYQPEHLDTFATQPHQCQASQLLHFEKMLLKRLFHIKLTKNHTLSQVPKFTKIL